MRNPRKKLLITGVSGLLGNNLAHYFKDKYEILGLYNSHPVTIGSICTEKCDISDKDSIRKIISEFNPSITLHCASLTDLDQCEISKELTKKINVLSTRNLIENIKNKDIKLIYISTDAVYDGVKGDFSESDHINPLGYYGLSKYEGELEVAKKENSLIFRTNIFGWNIQDKKSLAEWMLGELKAGRRINCFKDVYFSSIYTLEFARAIDLAIQGNLNGVYNCGASDTCSKYEFALKIADWFGLDKTLINPSSIDEFNFKAKRGKQLTLNVNKLQKALDYKLPTINQCLEAFYKDYRCGLPEKIKQDLSAVYEKPVYITYGRQWIDENDIQAVVNVLRSNRITQGPKVEEFEKSLSEYCGVKYAVAVNSGTSALHLACLTAGIKEGDEVITTPITFVASANCILYCGGKSVFVDINPDTICLDPQELEKYIKNKLKTQSSKFRTQPKAVIPVHFAGLPCDMESIKRIADEYGLLIIEDACHALGAEYRIKGLKVQGLERQELKLNPDDKWIKVGCCKHSDMTVFSFHPVKSITTGEGGAILTNNPEFYEKLLMLRHHGITRDPEKFTNRDLAFSLNPESLILNPNSWYYEMQELGYNYRITDIQCALGISQLKRLNEYIKKRREIADRYNEAFRGLDGVTVPKEPEIARSAYHLYILQINFEKIGKSRHDVVKKLREKGIVTQVHYMPVHLHPYYKERFKYENGDYPLAELYYKRCLSLPLFPKMNDSEVNYVIGQVKDVLEI